MPCNCLDFPHELEMLRLGSNQTIYYYPGPAARESNSSVTKMDEARFLVMK